MNVDLADFRPLPYMVPETTPAFPETSYDVIKMDVLQLARSSYSVSSVAADQPPQKSRGEFFELELHAAAGQGGQGVFRVFTHGGSLSSLNQDGGTKQVRMADSLDQAEDLYVAL